MKKKRKDKSEKPAEPSPVENYHFELQAPQPIFRGDGERDYFAEYYRAYKNDYIDQYLRAYREFSDLKKAEEYVNAMHDNPPAKPAPTAKPATEPAKGRKKRKNKKDKK